MPCVFFVSTRCTGTRCTLSAVTTALSACAPPRWPPFTITVVPSSRASPCACAIAASKSVAVSAPASTASSGRFGVITSASRASSRRAASASRVRSLSLDDATITGSNTTLQFCACAVRKSRTTSMISVVPSMPILMASISTSSATERSCARRNSTGGAKISCTPVVFCATSEVTTLYEYPPAAWIDLMSAWTPAPPVGSVPAIVRMRGSAGAACMGTIPSLVRASAGSTGLISAPRSGHPVSHWRR